MNDLRPLYQQQYPQKDKAPKRRNQIRLLCCLCLLLCGLLAACANPAPTSGPAQIEVQFSGGSGKLSILSPVQIEITDQAIMATLVWDSPYIEYMLIGDVRYEPQTSTAEGTSTFIVPIVLDTEMAVSASTIAMSQPHLIDYTLFFDSASIQGE